MRTKYHQMTLKDTFSDCQDIFMDDAPSFFQLLEQHFDISLFIPQTFYNAFYQHLGRKRDYPLTGFLSALILQKIFSIPTDSLLIILLILCKELRHFCGFTKVPDAPLFTRFKLGFASHIELMFQKMVDYTEPICQQIDSALAQILTFDTSGIELFVHENNPKTLNALIRKLKAFKLQLSVLIMYYDVECSLFPYDFPAVYFFETLESAKHFPVFFIYGLHHLHVGIAWQ